jgi:hypothetical protein
MKLPTASRLRKRKTLEAAAREFRGARGTERDEILDAQRALRRAEKFYDRAVARAQRDLATARAPRPIAAYGHQLILYDDRVSTPERTHKLVRSVRASVTDAPRRHHHDVELGIDGPGWREVVQGPQRDVDELRQLAQAVEDAAREAEAVKAVRQPGMESAEGRLAAARLDCLGVHEAKPLLDRVADLTEETERVLDMAPGISTGHDGVLAVTNRRLLFIGLRHTLLLPYHGIRSIEASGKWFGARLIVSSASGKHVVSGLPPRHAAEIVELALQRIGAASLVG